MKKILYIALLLPLLSFGQWESMLLASQAQFANESSIDSDAQAFIDAVGTLTENEKTYINTLVLTIKTNGTWNGYKCLYPFIGGTAFSHKWNLKDPRDLDIAFRMTWAGTITHNANGITPIVGYGNTHFIVSTDLPAISISYGFYNKTAGAFASCELGSYNGASTPDSYMSIFTNWGGTFYSWQNQESGISTTPNELGLITVTQNGGTVHKAFINGVQLGSTSTTDVTANFGNSIYPIFIGAQNNDGSAGDESTRNLAFAFIAEGLTDEEVLNDYIAIQAFQTSLSRNN